MGNLLSFNGRVRRRDWWLYNVIVFVITWAISQIVAPMALGDGGRVQIDPAHPFSPAYPAPLLGLLGALALFFLWPGLAMAAKRTHDRDKPANVTIILMLISAVFGWVGLAAPLLGLGSMLALVAMPINLVIGLYLLVVLGFLDGTPGPNQYGPSPKGLGGDGAA